MKLSSALESLHELDSIGRYVYTSKDLQTVFADDKFDTFRAGLKRLVENNILIRAAHSVYVFRYSRNIGADTLESIARTLRRGYYNYVSLESALSNFGVISQVPIDRLTVMTTGRGGEFKTPFGVVEFTRTVRPISQNFDNLIDIGRPLKMATADTALRDLRRVGRNLHLVDTSQIDE